MSISLFRKGASKTWHYRFQVNGARVQRSTRQTKRGAAEALAEKAYAAAVARANGGEPMPTLAELFQEWMTANAPVASLAHVRSVSVVQRHHLYDLGGLRVDDLTTERIEAARNKHLATHKPASTNHWLRVLKLVVNWAVKREVLARLPWKVKQLKVQKRPRAMLPLSIAMEWFGHIDQAVRKPEIAVAVRLMFGIGLRESEAITARWEWLDWDRKQYTPGITKGREADPVPVPEWLMAYLQPLRRAEGLIASGQHGHGLATGFARKPMARANAQCRLKGITPHRLRGTFATLLSEQGVPIQTIQRVLRHKDWTTTMTYLEVNLDLAVQGQAEIDQKMQDEWRKSGAQQPTPPATAANHDYS